MDTQVPLDQALTALGELLLSEGAVARVVVVGGAALNLLGVVERTTRDVDVIALAVERQGTIRLTNPEPLPAVLKRCIATVARDLQLPGDWMNTAVAGQWQTGLPPGMERRLTWRQFGGLRVGLAGREDLIALKVYAAADQTSPASRHMQDLQALAPNERELASAAAWIATQDPTIGDMVAKVVAWLRAHVR